MEPQNPSIMPDSISLYFGAIFDTKAALVLACKAHAMENNFEYITVKSDSMCYRIQCKNSDCSWILYASTLENTQRFCIKKFHIEHACYSIISTIHKQVTERYVVCIAFKLTAVSL